MSTYEWERGTIKLPRAAVSEVRTAIVDAANRAQQNLFDRATALLPKLLAAGKGKRGFDFAAAFHTMMTHSADSDGEDYHELQALLFPVKRRPLPRTGWGNHWEEIRPKKPTKPRKSSIKTIPKRGDIGVELDGAVTYTSRDHFFAAVVAGILFPMGGLSNPNGPDTSNATAYRGVLGVTRMLMSPIPGT